MLSLPIRSPREARKLANTTIISTLLTSFGSDLLQPGETNHTLIDLNTIYKAVLPDFFSYLVDPTKTVKYTIPKIDLGDITPAEFKGKEAAPGLTYEQIFETALQVLDEPERRAVLRQQADDRGVFLSDEVMDFMLNRFSRDLGSLMELLDLMDGYALQTQRAITIPLIKSMLENT